MMILPLHPCVSLFINTIHSFSEGDYLQFCHLKSYRSFTSGSFFHIKFQQVKNPFIPSPQEKESQNVVATYFLWLPIAFCSLLNLNSSNNKYRGHHKALTLLFYSCFTLVSKGIELFVVFVIYMLVLNSPGITVR